MYVDICKYKRGNKTYRRVLLREGYREGGKAKHRTLANLSHCSDEEIEAIRIALKMKKQIVYGLLTDEEGEPISIEAFCGNTKDNKTVRVEIETLKERFGCRHITLVGDKGMIKSGEIEDLKTAGFHYITSITKSQIKTLLVKGVFQLSLFDEDLCEVEDREEGVRYILRRNPFRAEEMHKTRLSKIEAIGEKIEKANRYLYEHKRAKIATQIRHIKEYIVKLKLDGLLDIEADEGKKQLKLNVDKEALCRAEELDGCYALKTDLPREVASKETIHDRYKGLSEVEWAFRTQKTGYLQVRPIYVRKRERSIAHLLIVMLAYKMERYLRSAWEDLDITVKEGISRLAKITSNVIAVGEKRFVTVLGLNRGHTAHFAPPKFGKAELHMSAELLIIC